MATSSSNTSSTELTMATASVSTPEDSSHDHNNQMEYLECSGCYFKYCESRGSEIKPCELQHDNLLEHELCKECNERPSFIDDVPEKECSQEKTNDVTTPKLNPVTFTYQIINVNLTVQRVKWINMDILNSPLCATKSTAIIQAIDAIGLEPKGFSLKLAEKFPYGNIYSRRQRYKMTNRAEILHRDTPGDIIISSSSDDNSPTIISIVNSFFIKGPVPNDTKLNDLLNYGIINDDQVSKIPQDQLDFHIYNHLLKYRTYSYNIRRWFKANMMNLFYFLSRNNYITDVCFQYKLGESQNFEWGAQVRMIEELARYIYPNITIHIIRPKEVQEQIPIYNQATEDNDIIEMDSDSTCIGDPEDLSLFDISD